MKIQLFLALIVCLVGCNSLSYSTSGQIAQMQLPEEDGVSLKIRRMMKLLERGDLMVIRKSEPVMGWTMPHPKRELVWRDELYDQCEFIIPYGRDAVPELLRWLDHKEQYMRYVAARSLKEITGLDPKFYYFGTPYKSFQGDPEWFQKAKQAWSEWYEKNSR
jgi:hypothetical protein